MYKFLLVMMLACAMPCAQADLSSSGSKVDLIVNDSSNTIAFPARASVPRAVTSRSLLHPVCLTDADWAHQEAGTGTEWGKKPWLVQANIVNSTDSNRFPIFICRSGSAVPIDRLTIIDTGKRPMGTIVGESVGKLSSNSLNCNSGKCFVFVTVDKDEQLRHCYVAGTVYPFHAEVTARVRLTEKDVYDLELADFQTRDQMIGAVELDVRTTANRVNCGVP